MSADLIRPLPSWSSDETWATFATGRYRGNFMGAELQKCDDDLERYRELVEISQPDIVIECGTRAGGSALWFHRELNLQVVTLDLAPRFDRTGLPPWNGPGISWYRGSSITEDAVRHVFPLVRGKRVMVSLDSDHHAPHVTAEMAVWGPLVTPGCYMVVEDACFEQWDPDRARIGGSRIPEIGGPHRAIQDQLAHPLGQLNGIFWRDETIEGMSPVSHSPMGWWRKHE